MTARELFSRVHTSELYAALTGTKPRRTGHRTSRGRATWRGGDGFNVAMDDSRGVWYDHVTGEHGGLLDLVQRVCGGSRAEALHYIADLAGVALDDRPADRQQRRAIAARHASADATAADIAYWRAALIPELDRHKLAEVDARDAEALERAASLQYRLTTGSPADIVREYIRAQSDDPMEVAQLIAVGRAHAADTERVTALLVLLLAAAEAGDDKSRRAAFARCDVGRLTSGGAE